MPKFQTPFISADYTTGIIDDTSVADSLLPKNAVRKGINVMFDRPRGSISQRNGTTLLGTAAVSAGNTILGIHNFRSSNASYNQLLSVATTVLYYLNSSNVWTSGVTGLTTGLKTRFLTYLDSVVFLNGTDQPQSWTGTGAWLTTGGALDIANFPKGKFATILNTRVFTAGVTSNLDTVYASSLESSSAISWTAGTKNFKVYPNDGNGNITSLKNNGTVILIFKERGLYRYDDNQLQWVANIGTTSHESVVNDDNGNTYFFGQGANGVGFYVTNGGRPSKISRAIIKAVEGISPSFYSNINGFTDGQKIYWSCGAVTLGAITYTNFWVIYNLSDKSWEFRNYVDSFRVFSQYINSSGSITVVGGDTDGAVQTINSGNTDNGTAITSECELGALTFGSRGREKVVDEIITYATHFQGLQFLAKVDNNPYIKIDDIDDYEKVLDNIPKLRGNKFYFKIMAINSGTPFQFDGFELPGVFLENYG